MPSSGLRTGGLGTGNAGDEDRGDVIDYLFAQVEDLAKDPRERAGLEWVARLLTFAVVCLWMPVVVTISCMTDLNKLRQHVYFFDFVCGKFPFVQATLEGVLATAALQMFMSMLPTVLMCIVRNFCTLKSGAWAQLELQNRYIVLQVVFVLLVTAINQTVLASLQTLIKSPQKIFPFLADNLPDNSHFYAGYLALGCASLAGNLLRLGVLPRYLAQRAAGSTPETAQQVAEEQALGDAGDGMGARMARAALMVTIALVFCTCMPLISLIAWVYFALGARTFRFLSVYLEARRPDLGGAFWLAALRSLLCAVVLFVFLMVGILSRVGNKPAAALAAASLFALALGSVRLEYLRGDSLPFEVVVEADSRVSSVAAAERLEGAPKVALYCQPECFPDER